MRILIISNSEWDDNNSFGNTFSNFFEGIDGIEFANIYCREGVPNTKMCSRFLCVSDKKLLRHLLNRHNSPVECMHNKKPSDAVNQTQDGNNLINKFIKSKRWSIFYILREVLWSISDYKTDEFYRFIDDFAPDILLLPTYPFQYINKMGLHLCEKYNLKIVSYMSDDEYSYRRISFSPLFWIRRYFQRKWVVKALRKSSRVYVISDIQKNDCFEDLGINTKILTKSYDFSLEKNLKREEKTKDVVRIVFAGNIGSGRWKSLSYITKAVERINQEGIKCELNIYTPTVITPRMRRKLQNEYCKLLKPVSYKEIQRIQKDSDIIVHVESFNLKDSFEVRQSFSTKIVDLFYQGSCIFAVGRPDEASILHLLNHDAAVVATNKEDVFLKLEKLVIDYDMRNSYREKAYACGLQYHNKENMQAMLMDDLYNLLDGEG